MEQVISTTVLPSVISRGRFSGRGAPWIGEFGLNFAVMIQVFERPGRADGGGDERTAFGGFSQLLETDLVAGFGERLEVGNHFVPIQQLAIDADGMAEVAFGRGRLSPEAQRHK